MASVPRSPALKEEHWFGLVMASAKRDKAVSEEARQAPRGH